MDFEEIVRQYFDKIKNDFDLDFKKRPFSTKYKKINENYLDGAREFIDYFIMKSLPELSGKQRDNIHQIFMSTQKYIWERTKEQEAVHSYLYNYNRAISLQETLSKVNINSDEAFNVNWELKDALAKIEETKTCLPTWFKLNEYLVAWENDVKNYNAHIARINQRIKHHVEKEFEPGMEP